MSEETFKVKSVEAAEAPSNQEQEAAVLETAAKEGEIAPEAAGVQLEDGVYKVNLDELTKTEENAVQERETEEVDVRQQTRDGQEVGERVREQPDQEAAGEPSEPARENESPIEYITDQTDDAPDAATKSEPVQTDNPKSEAERAEGLKPELPDGVDKLVEFMSETGGSLEDYLYLNKDVDNMNGVDLLREHYKQTNPDLTPDEVAFMLEDEFAYDKEVDSERDIKKKQIAWKKAVSEAKHSIKSMRDKFYTDLKFSRGNDLTPEQMEAVKAYDRAKETDDLNALVSEDYDKKTNQFFNEFKGFEFKLNDQKVRYKVADINKTKDLQMDPTKWLSAYTDDKGYLTNPGDWHKAMYAANNIDKIAQHFYDQGRADSVQEAAKKAKNIDMGARQDHSSIVTSDGAKIKVVSGNDSDKLRFRIGKYK